MKDFNEAFPEGLEMYERDKRTFKDKFVSYIFGGTERIRCLREFLDSIRKDLPTHLYVTTFGRGEEVLSMLKAAGLLRYFSIPTRSRARETMSLSFFLGIRSTFIWPYRPIITTS